MHDFFGFSFLVTSLFFRRERRGMDGLPAAATSFDKNVNVAMRKVK